MLYEILIFMFGIYLGQEYNIIPIKVICSNFINYISVNNNANVNEPVVVSIIDRIRGYLF